MFEMFLVRKHILIIYKAKEWQESPPHFNFWNFLKYLIKLAHLDSSLHRLDCKFSALVLAIKFINPLNKFQQGKLSRLYETQKVNANDTGKS